MIIETITLDSALCVTILDQTSHYFGGYFHVKVLAYCDVPVERKHFENETDFSRAVEKIGSSARFERALEKMAVPESEIDSVRSQLIRAFHDTTKAYLSAADFAPRFVRSEYLKHINKSSQIRIPRA